MDARPALHPPAPDLAAFIRGRLDTAAAEQVIAHLDGCADCRQAVAAQSGDDFLDRLRAAHGLSGTPMPDRSASDTPCSSGPGGPPPSSETSPLTPPPGLPAELAGHPQYEVLGELGRGGMGVVYLARHRLSGRREVLKVMNREALSRPGSKERFLREIQSAALLKHDYVVQMYTATEVGDLMVLVMEYVEGRDLHGIVRAAGPLPVALACRYAHQVALALQHAHERGLVHRDVKPHNLILTREGGKPVVKVLDFGLAKVKSEKRAELDLTGEGRMLGTPHYMAPEQIRDAAHADIRADVYGLGCTLHYLLTGAPPFHDRQGLFDVLQAHQSAEAPPVNALRPEVPPELAAVVARMMAKEPAQRYQTPIEAARALAPFLKAGSTAPPSALPVAAPEREGAAPVTMATSPPQARPQGAGAPPAKRKWPLRAAVAAVALLLTLAALWAGGVFRLRTPEGILVVTVNEPSPDVYVDGDKMTVTWGADGKTAEVRVRPGTRKVEVKKDGFTAFGEEVELQDGQRHVLTASLVRPAANGPPKRGDEQPRAAPVATTTGEYDPMGRDRVVHFGPGGPRVVLTFNDEKQHFVRVCDLATGQPVSPPLRHEKAVWYAAFSPDGRRVVTTSSDNTARLWDAATGKELTPPLRHNDFSVNYAAFSPDGRRVLTAGNDSMARVWDAASGKELTPPLRHGRFVRHASFSPDGRRVVTACRDSTARVWDAASGKELTPPLRHEDYVEYAAFSPDGKWVVTTSSDNTARVWDAGSGKALTPPLRHDKTVDHAAFSPDGKRVVTAGRDHTARIWDAATGAQLTPPLDHDNWVFRAVFSRDGRRVVTAGYGQRARLWDAATGRPLTPPLGPDPRDMRAPSHAVLSPDGRQVITSHDETAWVWDVETGKESKKVTIAPDVVRAPPPAPREAAAGAYEVTGGDHFAHFGPGGPRVVLRFNDKGQKRHFAQVYDLAAGKALGPPLLHDATVQDVTFSPDGKKVVTLFGGRFNGEAARVWDAATGQALTSPLSWKITEKTLHSLYNAVFSPDGKKLVITSSSEAWVLDAATGKELTPPLKVSLCRGPRFSPDGRRILTTSDKAAHVWDAATGKEVGQPLRHEDSVWCAAFSPDGRRVVTTSTDKTARVWDLASGRPVTPPLRHDNSVWYAAFSPDGKRVVTASQDKTARVWDAASGQPVTPPLRHDDAVEHAGFSPDGKQVVTASLDKTARLWDTATGRASAPPLKHDDRVRRVAFSPDGKRVVTACYDNSRWLWDAQTGQELKKVAASEK